MKARVEEFNFEKTLVEPNEPQTYLEFRKPNFHPEKNRVKRKLDFWVVSVEMTYEGSPLDDT